MKWIRPITELSEETVLPFGFEEFSAEEGDKYLVLNCCYSDTSAQGQLAIEYAEDILSQASKIAQKAGARLLVTVFTDSEADKKLSTLAETVKVETLAILAEPSALCAALSGLPAMSGPEMSVKGLPALVITPMQLKVPENGCVLALKDIGLYAADNNITWGMIASEFSDELSCLLVGGVAEIVVDSDMFESPVMAENQIMEPLFDGTVVPVTKTSCPVDVLAKKADIAHRSSCGKCVMCRLGTKQICLIAKAVSDAAATSEELDNITYIADGMIHGAACGFGRAFGRFTEKWMKAYGEDFQQHIRRKKCASLVCRGYITYHVLPNKCDGCDGCRIFCAKDAIMGEKKEIHVIDAFLCDKCGDCIGKCPEEAIVKAGVLKPKTPKEPIPVGTWKR